MLKVLQYTRMITRYTAVTFTDTQQRLVVPHFLPGILQTASPSTSTTRQHAKYTCDNDSHCRPTIINYLVQYINQCKSNINQIKYSVGILVTCVTREALRYWSGYDSARLCPLRLHLTLSSGSQKGFREPNFIHTTTYLPS